MTEKTYYERYWQKEFNSYGKGVAELPPEWNEGDLERVLSFCDGQIQGRVLDAGCGDGFFAAQISQRHQLKDTVGIDVSAKAVEMARGRYPDVRFEQGELNDLPLESASIDSITMVEVIEHLVDVESALEEFSRVIKPGGILLITTTDFNWLKGVVIAMFFFEKYFYPTNPHIRFFTKSTLAEVLGMHGFTVVKYAWNGGYFGMMPKGQMVLAQKQGE